jgi:predicted PurR-regulated permease PerM
MVRAAWFALVITATILGLALLWRFGTILVIFLLSLAIAAALRPVIHAASSKRLSRRTGLSVVYALLVLMIVGGLLLILPPLVRDLQQATNDLLTGYEQARTDWPHTGGVFQRMLAEQLPPSEEIYASLIGPEGMAAIEGLFGAAGGFLSLLGYLSIAIILSLYWSADQFRFERLSLSLLPDEQHARALHAWRAVETGVGAFLRSAVLQSLVTLVALGVGYWALGLKYPVLLAVWATIAGLIPWFGVLVTLLPAVFIWFGISPAAGFIFVIFTVSVLILRHRILRPRLFETPQYNSMLTLLLILAMGQGFGLIGILLAPLLTLALRILFEDLNPLPRGRFSAEVMRKASEIQQRLSVLRGVRENGASAEARLLVDRINRLARSTREYLRGF